jgi:hypothetical protein
MVAPESLQRDLKRTQAVILKGRAHGAKHGHVGAHPSREA